MPENLPKEFEQCQMKANCEQYKIKEQIILPYPLLKQILRKFTFLAMLGSRYPRKFEEIPHLNGKMYNQYHLFHSADL